MVQKKICMLGYFAVGKSSLVRRYVNSMFSEDYVTTIGVKIDKKTISLAGKEVVLVVWDVYGEDSHQSVMPAYLRGMAGYLLVVDPTRPTTVESGLKLNKMVQEVIGNIPFILVKNKSDLKEEWVVDSDDLKVLESTAFATIETSAKTDSNVNEMFEKLALAVVDDNQRSS